MLKGQTLSVGTRRNERITNHVMPKQEPRCVGRGCDQRGACERYQRAVFESSHRNAQKGAVLMMSMADSDGVCRRKM